MTYSKTPYIRQCTSNYYFAKSSDSFASAKQHAVKSPYNFLGTMLVASVIYYFSKEQVEEGIFPTTWSQRLTPAFLFKIQDPRYSFEEKLIILPADCILGTTTLYQIYKHHNKIIETTKDAINHSYCTLYHGTESIVYYTFALLSSAVESAGIISMPKPVEPIEYSHNIDNTQGIGLVISNYLESLNAPNEEELNIEPLVTMGDELNIEQAG